MKTENDANFLCRTSNRSRGVRLFLTVAPAIISLLLPIAPAVAQSRIERTVHNLTPGGPGSQRVSESTGPCVFCHISHNAKPGVALWNRELPGITYKLYSSSTLEATLNQPTGSSRLCLSCHDGLLALSNLRVPPKGSHFTLGPLTGKASLGTDLSADHPISFTYDSVLAARQGELVDPAQLPPQIRLDSTGQLQCTTCHDPHQDQLPNFLRMSNEFGALCTACHRLRNWKDSTHATSTAIWKGVMSNPWPDGAFPTVAQNACLNCHRPHAAGHPERLLAQSMEPDNCNICHNSSVTNKDVADEFLKPSHHPIESSQWTHDPKEVPVLMPDHVTCVDCHNPHQTTSTAAPTAAPSASGRLRGVQGVTLSGSVIDSVNNEYEVCLKCHGMKEPTTVGEIRQDNTRNIRLEIALINPSFHPIAAPGKNTTIAGLEPGYTASSMILCTDCHNNDQWTPAGLAPRGPHGSRYEPILVQEFQAGDPSPESFSTYALCYNCHDRATLFTDGPGRFPHNSHVVLQNTSCAVCHDAHGSRQNPHLINFMLRAKAGNTVVSPSVQSGRLQYVPDPTNPGHGSCYLNCHGVEHNPMSY